MSGTEAHLDSPLLLACRDLARAMDRFDEAACAALGLGRSDLRALNLLEHGPLGASVLARRLGLTRPAVTALIDRLADAGYVERVAVPGDRRATAVELQPATWKAFAQVYRPLGEQVWAATSNLAEPEREAVAAAMTTMTGVFDDARDRISAGQARSAFRNRTMSSPVPK
jgi:DNA-binding MarR family transcriptional regulator